MARHWLPFFRAIHHSILHKFQTQSMESKWRNALPLVCVYHGLSNKSPAKLGVASGNRHRSFYYDQIFDCPSCHNHGSAEKWVYLQLLVSFHLVGNFPLNHDYGRKATLPCQTPWGACCGKTPTLSVKTYPDRKKSLPSNRGWWSFRFIESTIVPGDHRQVFSPIFAKALLERDVLANAH